MTVTRRQLFAGVASAAVLRPAYASADVDVVVIGAGAAGLTAAKRIRDMKRELSNARIVAYGMEMLPVHWLIGNKIYEPGKIRMYLEAIWPRLQRLEKLKCLRISPAAHGDIVREARDTTVLLRRIKKDVAKGHDTVALAKDVFRNLNRVSTAFLGAYFQTVNARFKH